MCQLLGINSQQPVNPRWLLAEFFQRGGATAEHADGWGVASYDEWKCPEHQKFVCSQLR